VNLPDNIRGAYIFRNGFAEAVDILSGRGRFTKVIPIARYALARPEDTVLITRRDHVFEVKASNADTHFIIRGMGDRTTLRKEDFEIVEFTDRAYVVKLSDFGASDRLALYSSSRLLTYDFD
jgi:hypothetical protein